AEKVHHAAVALADPRAPQAQLVPRTKCIADLSPPLRERWVLGKDPIVAGNHPVLNDGRTPARLLGGLAKETVGDEPLTRRLVHPREVIVRAIPVIDTDAATDPEADARQVTDRTEPRAIVEAGVQAVVIPPIVLNSAPRIVA